MSLSSLPMLVDVGDWLAEDLPTKLGVADDSGPGEPSADGHPDGYWSVTLAGGTDATGRDRPLAVVAEDDEWGWQLAGVVGDFTEFGI
jgi:hypothetical protein